MSSIVTISNETFRQATKRAQDACTISDMRRPLDTFGRRLADLRTAAELTQMDLVGILARDYGVHIGQTYISELERSRDDKTPLGYIVAAMARALSTTADYLLGLTDDDAPHSEPPYISPEADEIAVIVDRMPPFRRGEMLAHARMIEIMEAENERDVAAAMNAVAAQLRAAGLVVGADALAEIRRALLDYAAALLGADALRAVDAMTAGGTNGRDIKRRRQAP